MRYNHLLMLCTLALGLAGCEPKGVTEYRRMDERQFPDPTKGTENVESSWYKTQMLSAPSEATAGGAAAAAPAAKPAATVPATKPPAKASAKSGNS